MDDLSVSLIRQALNGLHLRYGFTAQNLANANSPDYRPVRVTFEDELKAAASHGVDAVNAVSPNILADTADATGPVRLDLELAQATQTAMRYRALLDLLGRQYALVHAAAATRR